MNARRVEHAFGLRRVRDCGYHEVGAGEHVVELVGGVELDVGEVVLGARLYADDFHAELVADAGRLVAYAADAVDERGCLAEEDVRRLAGVLAPYSVALGVHVPGQASR